jgi:glutathione S-transferase
VNVLEIAVVSYEPDDEVKQKKLQTLNNEVIPFYLEKLEDIAKENGGYLSIGRVNTTSSYILIFAILNFQPLFFVAYLG